MFYDYDLNEIRIGNYYGRISNGYKWTSTLNNPQIKIEIKKPKYALNSTIKSITLNKKKGITTVVFNDGDVQMSKCSDKDVFDETVGVALCIASHFAGSKTKFKNFVAEHIKEVKK